MCLVVMYRYNHHVDREGKLDETGKKGIFSLPTPCTRRGMPRTVRDRLDDLYIRNYSLEQTSAVFEMGSLFSHIRGIDQVYSGHQNQLNAGILIMRKDCYASLPVGLLALIAIDFEYETGRCIVATPSPYHRE